MISKMIRYDIVLYAGEQEHFVEELRTLGLMDITTTGWEPSECDRALLMNIEAYNKALEFLATYRTSAEYNANVEICSNGVEAYECYDKARSERQRITQEVARLEKLADEVAPWGNYSLEDIARLSEQGVTMRFFMAQPAAFDKIVEEAMDGVTIAEVGRTQSAVYFAVVTTDNSAVVIDGQEVRLPQMDSDALRKEVERLNAEDKALDVLFSRAAASSELIAGECGKLKEQLQGLKVGAMAQREADGRLLILEGWAEAETAQKVDALLEEYPNLIFERRDATIDDDAPVKLKNNKFARLFELIGAMYALPKYGTIDLTAIFGPFYMLLIPTNSAPSLTLSDCDIFFFGSRIFVKPRRTASFTLYSMCETALTSPESPISPNAISSSGITLSVIPLIRDIAIDKSAEGSFRLIPPATLI